MDNLKQVDVKIFVKDATDVQATEFVAVLQRWIQQHSVGGVLIDVVDYSHINNGAGVILVGHEANISIDYTDGRMGLLYHAKFPEEDTLQARLDGALARALDACALLEREEEFKGRLTFDTKDILFLASDRLNAPSDDEAIAVAFKEAVSSALAKVGASDAKVEVLDGDPRARLSISATNA